MMSVPLKCLLKLHFLSLQLSFLPHKLRFLIYEIWSDDMSLCTAVHLSSIPINP